ncbi:sigma factor-like helix-turn-helix DNA-binding protein [Streptosporangium sp. NPDC005286]|uniref:sigma factor-like helix-turn-helix DNA-binding protein n=1 Tax=Streptosporangium sp. NPDC005286 TaxID=3154463 RepID=UPI0033AED967
MKLIVEGTKLTEGAVEDVARLVEESSLGTVEARQLRDLADLATADRVLARAYFIQTDEGAAWWRTNQRDPDALREAAAVLVDGDEEEHLIAVRLLRLACHLQPPHSEQSAADETVEQASSEVGPVEDRAIVKRSSAEAQPFADFYHENMPALKRLLEAHLDADEVHTSLREAVVAAFDRWDEGLCYVVNPERWILGHARSGSGKHVTMSNLVLVCRDHNDALSIHESKESDTDMYIQGLLMSLARLDTEVIMRTAERMLELAHVRAWAHTCMADEAELRHTLIGKVRDYVHLTELLIGDVASATEVVAAAFNRVRKTWDEDLSLATCETTFRQALVNQSRAALRLVMIRQDDMLTVSLRRTSLSNRLLLSLRRPHAPSPLHQLTTREREALVLRYYTGTNIQQTADAMGISTHTVEEHLERARRRVLGKCYSTNYTAPSTSEEPSPERQLCSHSGAISAKPTK